MDSLHVVFLLLAVTKCYSVSADSPVRYMRFPFLNSNVCPETNVITETVLAQKIECVYLCSETSSCRGVFFQPVNKHCILCSARYLTQENISYSPSYEFFGLDSKRVTVFWLVKKKMENTFAKEECVKLGGHLSSIKTSSENNFIKGYVLKNCNTGVWLNGYGTGGVASSFRWADGTYFSDGFTNWYPSQPYHRTRTYTCVSMYPGYWQFRWDDGYCHGKNFGLCRYN